MNKTIAVALAFAALLLPVRAQALDNEDLLALVAMPLAVAAVSEITDVPMNDLVDVVTLLNDAAVPPPQFIEVVRYVPVALVVEQPNEPSFVEFLRLRESEGVRGTALVTSIENRLRVYDVDVVKLSVDRPRVYDIDDDFVPQIVRTRITEARSSSHPHGGPPGQLKKTAGVQTGAEIVHRSSHDAGRRGKPARVVDADRKVSKAPPRVVKNDAGDKRPKVTAKKDDHGNGRGRDKADRGNGKGNSGHGKGHGKGKG